MKEDCIVIDSIFQGIQPERVMSVLQSVFRKTSPEATLKFEQGGNDRILRIEAGGFA